MKQSSQNRPHSAEYFGGDRDFFWNADFLDLMARRLDLQSIESVADLGCGVGHWSKLLLPRLSSKARLVGIDREPSHVADFMSRFSDREAGAGRVTAIQADATSLPIPDGSCDLATCQTLLLHVQDPAAALREMIRITKPGGLILCVEPNNLVARLPFSGFMGETPADRLVRLSEMAWRYVLGRAQRGLGSEFIGEMLPGLFATMGLKEVAVWLSDKTAPLIPPYSSPAEKAAMAAGETWRDEGIGPFDRSEAQANVFAGGGTKEFFERAWADYLELDRQTSEAISQARWHSAGGTLFYIVAGRKAA